MPKASDALFISMAPAIMRMLMRDFAPFTKEDAAAVLGNLGHESGGFRFLQEKKPLVPGSRGGYGWAQWTGPRRRAYEAFCKGRFDPASAEANYGFLHYELTETPEKAAIPAVRKAVGLAAKVKAFELKFERASPKYKHYESRLVWAKKALAALEARPSPTLPKPRPIPDVDDDMAAALRHKTKVQDVQKSLVEFGYPTGAIDGEIGTLTTAALAAYRFDRNLPPAEGVDDALIADMLKAAKDGFKRPISEERANKPATEIAKESATMKISWWGKLLLWLGIPGAVAGQGAEEAINPDRLEERLSFLQRVGHWASDNPVLLAILAAVLIGGTGIFIAINWLKVRDYREGKRA